MVPSLPSPLQINSALFSHTPSDKNSHKKGKNLAAGAIVPLRSTALRPFARRKLRGSHRLACPFHLPCPHLLVSLLSVDLPHLTRAHDGPIDLIVDSTGLKFLGRGQWNAHKHKTSKKRRDWRELHIGVDAEGFIVAAELTASGRDDAFTLPDLLAPLEVPIRRFTADGAYDHRSVYDRASAAGTENVVIVIPPRRSALSAGPTDGPWAQREASLQRIRKVGRREWQKESGYRQQARLENSFFRYKSVFGSDLKARHSKAQRREAAIGCHILNRMAELGRPSSYPLGR